MNKEYAYLLKDVEYSQLPTVLQHIYNQSDIKQQWDKSERMTLRYEANKNGVPILTRRPPSTPLDTLSRTVVRLDKDVNNCINRNFESDIVDTKVGFFAKEIVYSVPETSNFEDALMEFNKNEAIAELDMETTKSAAIAGVAYRLLYVDYEGNAKVMNLPTTDKVTVLSRTGVSNPDYAIRVYTNQKFVDGAVKSVEYLEFYDETHIWTFDLSDSWRLVNYKPHLFVGCPLYGVANNNEYQGDFEKVIPAIDAYNRTISDVSDEIEQTRLSYLVLRGMGFDDEEIEDFREKGIIEILGEGAEVNYLTKDVNDQMIENHLNRLERDIYRDAKSVDFADLNFGSNSSGVAMQYKNQGLENKCSSFEHKFRAMLRYQYMLLNKFWTFKDSTIEDLHNEIQYTFKRGVPIDNLEAAEVQSKLIGLVPDAIRLSQFPGIEDVEAVIEQMKEEKFRDIEDYETMYGVQRNTEDNTTN